jgi:signal transduction histidine kinase
MVTVKHEKTLRNEARPHTYGFKALDSDGNTKWVEISAVLIEWQARPATLNFIEDITGKRRMEEELVRMERFESIGILAGGIAHDFNNILTAILGNISLAKMHLSPSDKVFQKLTEAEKASVAAQSLTQQLLTFARGGALMKRLSHIPQVVESACRFALTGANVRCHFRWPPDLWTVEVDEGQISHVINNLIINAAQAMPQGGLVTVSAENAFLHAQSGLPLVQGKYVKLSIEDHGTGIPQDLLSRVFDPYFTTKQTGTGLGLTMCYSVTKNHGGLITVDSEVGVGTTFQIYLPASEREADTVQESEARIHGLL